MFPAFLKNFRIRAMIAIAILALLLGQAPLGMSQAARANSAPAQKLAASGFDINSLRISNLGLLQGSQGKSKMDPHLVRELKQNARGSVSVKVKNGTGYASFVSVDRGGDLHPANQARVPEVKAAGFFAHDGALFGSQRPASELEKVDRFTDQLGVTHITYQQMYQGLPVFAGILRAHVDATDQLTAVNGAFVPDIQVNTTPQLSSQEAADAAISAVLANPPANEVTGAVADLSSSDLRAASQKLYVYNDGLIQDIAGLNYLVYEVEVTNGSSLRDLVYIDAHNGAVINRISLVEDALFRRLFEQNTSNQVWQEGDPFPGILNADQQNIVNGSGEAYYLFYNAFGRDSYDAAGHEMQSVNNDPTISCPNANWNGATTNYCNGVTSDDVVAHEWGHAYTQYTHGLIYQWQSGALNESYSDIWGEVVDMINGHGTDSPAPVRSVDECSSYTTPIPELVINAPASIAGSYAAGAASFGPPVNPTGVTGTVVLANDGTGTTTDACTALVNGGAISGNVALVDRGTCAFTIKVKNAQDAGAIAVIVADNVTGPVAGMGGSDPTIVITSVRVTLATGNLIKGELAGGVNATLTLKGASTAEDSYRWLMGEDATAFGGAIRDMWAPTCLADPGKVSDSEYFCAASDGGGVHTNSGVPNHGFALLVDGGTYNGHTVNAIGLTKAAHLYWRAAEVYQTPTSGFSDHADALGAACEDLQGVNLQGLSTSSTPAGPSGKSFTPADCTAVAEMIAAVELRTPPTQCNFQPILQPDPPAICTSGNPSPVFKEDFENGLGSWTLSNQGVFSGWLGLDWMRSKDLPAGRNGPAAFAPDPNAGNCDGGAGDISGSMSMESPLIKIPSGRRLSPRMSFLHYIASEQGWDGGNLKISINGGPYVLVPSSAYLFNAYNLTLNPPPLNTNPLASQAAFSGTDGGSLLGSWGESQINLAALGVKPGDTIRLRFDFGMDGCAGNDGWYVDDIEVVTCRTP